MDSNLEKIVQDSLIVKSKQDYILAEFKDFTAIADEWREKAMAIVVTDESQVELISQAKEGKKILKAKRIEIEKTRKKLKEQSLQEGRLIDGVAKHLMAIIEPAEKHLELQESFVLVMEQKRKAEVKAKRIEMLIPYSDVLNSEFLQLDIITDEAFEGLLKNAKFMQQAKAESERLEREEQQKAEQAEREEAEKLAKEREEERIELARVKEQLRAEREQKEKEDAIRLQKEIEDQAKQKEAERLAKQREEEIIELAHAKEQLIAEREQKEKDDAIRLQKEIEAQAELERVKSELEQKSIEVDKNKNELITVFSVWNKETEKYEEYQGTGVIIEDVEQVPVFQVYNTTTNADVEIDYIAQKELTLVEAVNLIVDLVLYCEKNKLVINEPLASRLKTFL
jgi:hypothetical protein